ncbi:MAG: hypothetical protein ACOX60_03585 [Massiliimalia sp.]
MNPIVHVLFCLIAVLFFGWRFIKSRYWYYLVLVIWLLSTFIVYVPGISAYRLPVAAGETGMFVLFLIANFSCRKKRKKEQRYYENLRKQLEQAEQEQRSSKE